MLELVGLLVLPNGFHNGSGDGIDIGPGRCQIEENLADNLGFLIQVELEFYFGFRDPFSSGLLSPDRNPSAKEENEEYGQALGAHLCWDNHPVVNPCGGPLPSDKGVLVSKALSFSSFLQKSER